MITTEEKLDMPVLFSEIAESIHRPGINQLLTYLHKETDFFKAPASTKYHGAEAGGLVKHSLQVYYNLMRLAPDLEAESIKIVSLFHDICKANFYKESTRNVKNQKTGKWEQVPCYVISEQFPFGAHGGKSVFLVQRFIDLTDEEEAAINCHMGGWDTSSYHNPSAAYEKYPLAVYLHIADMLATYITKC